MYQLQPHLQECTGMASWSVFLCLVFSESQHDRHFAAKAALEIFSHQLAGVVIGR
jgi:hypothetical protein